MRASVRVSVGVFAAASLAGLWALGGPADAVPVTAQFNFEGDVAQDFEVPANVCQVTIDAEGAAGGDGSPFEEELAPTGEAPSPQGAFNVNFGGGGGQAVATITVTPGETLQINVGGSGEDGTGDAGGAGGFNGGADGGFDADDGNDGGGGGGGASDVRQGGSGLENRVVIGGGGGGGGGDGEGAGAGGAGGGVDGLDGDDSTSGTSGGGGGTETAGGEPGPNGDAGEQGDLGAGGAGASGLNDGGGGGGGGLYGGAGGNGDFGKGVADGGGGGGGSGFTPDGTGLTADTNPDDGVVFVTYDPDAGGCAPAPSPVVIEPRFTG